jgi:hypothetical protein
MFATYTAFNGHCILPKLISTEDFYSFNVMPLYGVGSKIKSSIISEESQRQICNAF